MEFRVVVAPQFSAHTPLPRTIPVGACVCIGFLMRLLWRDLWRGAFFSANDKKKRTKERERERERERKREREREGKRIPALIRCK